MRRALVAMLGVVSLAGCAGLQTSDTRSAEHALSTAGFQALPADTPEKVTHLKSLPPRRLVRRTDGGQTHYVYADPATCQCLYVGGDTEYQRLRQQEASAEKNFFAVEDSSNSADFGLWEIGRP
jgi:hypothetical protein